ncbi:helix-turn-helix transcriptional regulator [Clostridium algidicarnis]|uniref:Helix-turn-helix domain-containing protein n=1 Tax=Clostridium algidicarnis TaxID=37659 RepID=A0ABS6C1V8_9CLOT|nr:helix-turn-helix transcriptional regulator [Clostridium algidicarnis]MBU3219468.1 helix-turn-helix domain-containing protein [Clostridium algidicarnis]
MHKTTTYKEVFEPLDANSSIIYSLLPEETIAQKIYKLRISGGYTRRNFAKICNIGYSSICKYEIGLSIPNEKNICKISKALNIDLNYLNC